MIARDKYNWFYCFYILVHPLYPRSFSFIFYYLPDSSLDIA